MNRVKELKIHGSYGVLLFDKRWKDLRNSILKRDNHKCNVCKSFEELQIHHRQYHFLKRKNQFKKPWEYEEKLLITLCKKCHQKGHQLYQIPIKYI